MFGAQNKEQEQFQATLAKLRTLSGSQAENQEASRHFLWFFTFVLVVVEAVNLYIPAFPLLLHLILLQVLIVYVSLHWRYPAQRNLLVLALPSIMRILLLGAPLEDLSIVYRSALQGIGTFVVATVLIFTLRLDWEEIGLNFKNFFLQLPIALTGILFGISFSILAPFQIQINQSSLNTLLIEASLVFFIGMLEAFIFQGLILNIIGRIVNRRLYAPFWVALIYSSLFVAQGSGIYLLLVFGTSFFFAHMSSMSRSVIGTCLAYGLLNLVFFVLVPSGALNFLGV